MSHHETSHDAGSYGTLPMGAPDYFEREIRYGTIFKWVIAFLVFVFFSMAVVRLLYWAPGLRPDGKALEDRSMSHPALQVRPRENLEAMRKHEKERLETYGWIGAPGGAVHIPIERAIELYVEREGKKGQEK